MAFDNVRIAPLARCLRLLLLVWAPEAGCLAKGFTLFEGTPVPGAKDLAIKAVPNKLKVYAGQPFTVSYLLYYRVPVIDPQNEINLKFKNCWVEEYPQKRPIERRDDLDPSSKVLQLKKYVVIPQLEGPLLLPILKQNYRVTAAPDPNSFFGEEKIVSKTIESMSTSVDVMALPSYHDSIPFANAVGVFRFHPTYTVSKKADNLLTFKLQVSGQGNLRNVRVQAPILPTGLDVYNTQVSEHHSLGDSSLQANCVFSFDVVAHHRGSYKLPGISFVYFNPDLHRYVTFGAPAFTWAVADPSLTVLQPPSSESVNISKKPVLYSKKNLFSNQDLFTGSTLYYTLLVLLLTLIIAAVFIRNYQNHRIKYIKFYNHKKAFRKASQQLELIKDHHYPQNIDAYCKGLQDVLMTYVSHKLYASKKIQSASELDQCLRLDQLPIALRAQTAAAFALLYRLRFSSISVLADDTLILSKMLVDIIDKYEKYAHEKRFTKTDFVGQ